MSKKRGDVSPGVPDAPAEGVPLADLASPDYVPPDPAPDPFKGRRGAKGDPLTRPQYWVVGESPATGSLVVLSENKSKAGAIKWRASVRNLLAATFNNVRIVRVKPVQPEKWGG